MVFFSALPFTLLHSIWTQRYQIALSAYCWSYLSATFVASPRYYFLFFYFSCVVVLFINVILFFLLPTRKKPGCLNVLTINFLILSLVWERCCRQPGSWRLTLSLPQVDTKVVFHREKKKMHSVVEQLATKVLEIRKDKREEKKGDISQLSKPTQ